MQKAIKILIRHRQFRLIPKFRLCNIILYRKGDFCFEFEEGTVSVSESNREGAGTYPAIVRLSPEVRLFYVPRMLFIGNISLN